MVRRLVLSSLDTLGALALSCSEEAGDVAPTSARRSRLADPLVAEIESACTSARAEDDAGADACAKAFGSCAAGIYLSRVPDCPEVERPR